jgi:tyrosine-protein kinase Etk/Wzc
MNSTIFVELKKQYELAKLDEIKNTTVVNILDRASTPIRKSRPKRATNAGVMFLITFAGLSSYFIVRTKHWSKIESLRKVFRP